MDNLTHTLVGVMLSRAGFNRLTPSAGWVLAVAANSPDLDIVAGLQGSVSYLEHHRGWTHAAAYAPLVALGPLLLWWLLNRKGERGRRRWLAAYFVSVAGVLSHLLLDWMNVYGIRLLLPFRQDWFRLDILHIVDIWVWAILLFGLAASLLARLVNTEIGAVPGSGRGLAWISIVLLCGYIGWRAYLHSHALATLQEQTQLDAPPRRVAAFPTPLNPWRWTGLVETAESYRIYPIHLIRDFDDDAGRTLFKLETARGIAEARNTATASSFLRFAQFPFWRTVPSSAYEGGIDVRLTDLRFGMPDDNAFVVSVQLDAALGPKSESFQFGPPQPR